MTSWTNSMSPTIAGRRSPERRTAACPVTFLTWAIGFWAVGGASAAKGTAPGVAPTAAIENAAANHVGKPKFFLPANFFLPG
jgi:hypothetical protein